MKSMETKVYLEGDLSVITLSNIGELDEFDFNIDDINEEADINEIFEQIDAFSESGELDLATDIKKFKVMAPEDISYLGIAETDEDEREVSLDTFTLKNGNFQPVKELLEFGEPGDLIYLRKEQGKSNWEFTLERENNETPMTFSYFDCAHDLDQYDLLAESYYDVLCDTFIPESLSAGESKAVVDNFDVDPQLVYGELYKVIEDPETWDKSLERIEVPGFYFLDKTRGVDE
jgi:hypothetical protein